MLNEVWPVVLIILGIIVFIFAGMAKWLVRLAGFGVFLYGLLVLLEYL